MLNGELTPWLLVDLDFLGVVKLVNYLRREVEAGVEHPDISETLKFADERYLKPVLEDDALLWNLHDIVGDDLGDVDEDSGGVPVEAANGTTTDSDVKSRITELEEGLRRAELEIEARRNEIKFLQQKFEECDSVHERALHNSTNGERGLHSLNPGPGPAWNAFMLGNTDSSYFASYSGHGGFSQDSEVIHN